MALLRVVNASPLILLSKIDCLHLLNIGGREVLIPYLEYREVNYDSRDGSRLEHKISTITFNLMRDIQIPPDVTRHALDPGESMVLAQALTLQNDGQDVEVVLDEKRGRRAAMALNLPLVGTAGLLLLGKSEGRLNQIKPLLDQLQAVGMYLNEVLRKNILDPAGEVET